MNTDRRQPVYAINDGEAPFRFLPELGKATPGRQNVGIVRSNDTNPNDFLSTRVGRTIVGDRESVLYAIPDVLASESWMHQLVSDHRSSVSRLPQIGAWRGTLAALLLWSTWEEGMDRFPAPLVEKYEKTPDKPFATTVLNSVSKANWPDIRVLYFERLFDNGRKYKFPLAFVSWRTIIVPAENHIIWHENYPHGLKPLLPETITWYSESERRFLDPCDTLNEVDRIRLGWLLMFLLMWNEWDVVQKMPSFAKVKGSLLRFYDDINLPHHKWFATLTSPERADLYANIWSEAEWRTRAAFSGIKEVTSKSIELLLHKHICGNVLLPALIEDFDKSNEKIACRYIECIKRHFIKDSIGDKQKGDEIKGDKIKLKLTCYYYKDIPFALEDRHFLLRPYDWCGVTEATHLELKNAITELGDDGQRCFCEKIDEKMAEASPHDTFLKMAKEWKRRPTESPAE